MNGKNKRDMNIFKKWMEIVNELSRWKKKTFKGWTKKKNEWMEKANEMS